MLGNTKSKKDRKYLTLRDGMVVYKNNGKEETYSYVEGNLSKVFKLDRNFNGETVPMWYMNIESPDGESYSISFPYNSGPFKSIVLSLASLDSLTTSTTIRIETYEKNGFTKVVTRADGNKLDWVTSELPATTTVVVSGQKVKDSSKRMEFIEGLVSKIEKNLERGPLGDLFSLMD